MFVIVGSLAVDASMGPPSFRIGEEIAVSFIYGVV